MKILTDASVTLISTCLCRNRIAMKMNMLCKALSSLKEHEGIPSSPFEHRPPIDCKMTDVTSYHFFVHLKEVVQKSNLSR